MAVPACSGAEWESERAVFFHSPVTVTVGQREGAADVSSAAWFCLSVKDWRLMSSAEVGQRHDVELSAEHFSCHPTPSHPTPILTHTGWTPLNSHPVTFQQCVRYTQRQNSCVTRPFFLQNKIIISTTLDKVQLLLAGLN